MRKERFYNYGIFEKKKLIWIGIYHVSKFKKYLFFGFFCAIELNYQETLDYACKLLWNKIL